MKKNHSFFTPLGKMTITLGVVAIVAVTLLAIHANMVHEEVSEIKSDGGYYAVGEKINEFGLPEIVRKNLE